MFFVPMAVSLVRLYKKVMQHSLHVLDNGVLLALLGCSEKRSEYTGKGVEKGRSL